MSDVIKPAETQTAPEGSSIPLVNGLSPGIVPLREFPLRKWYYATPLWYYHAPALEHRLFSDADFFERVDPAQRELCRIALHAGLCTTPSCQGHFYPELRFMQIWERLVVEGAQIRAEGLSLKNSETDQPAVFRDADYRLPWRTFSEFYAQAGANQVMGYIGLAIPSERSELIAPLCEMNPMPKAVQVKYDEELSRLLGQPLVGFFVQPQNPIECDAAWAAITSHVGNVLAGRLPPNVGASAAA